MRKSRIPFLSKWVSCSVFCNRATARCSITWQRNCNEVHLLGMLIHTFSKTCCTFGHCVMYGNKLRVGGSEGVNERSDGGLYLPVFQKNIPCWECDIHGKPMLLELFLNMELSPVKCGNCFSPCKVHGDILQDWELIPGPSSLWWWRCRAPRPSPSMRGLLVGSALICA